jgi:hypothetical protein
VSIGTTIPFIVLIFFALYEKEPESTAEAKDQENKGSKEADIRQRQPP